MSYDRDRSIIAQNAGTTAANLVATMIGGHGFEVDKDDLFELFVDIRQQVFDGTLALAGEQPTAVGVADVVRAFPGATTESATAFQVTGSGGNKGDVKFTSGKHNGKTIAQVDAERGNNGRDVGRDYLTWYADKGTNDSMVRSIKTYLSSVGVAA